MTNPESKNIQSRENSDSSSIPPAEPLPTDAGPDPSPCDAATGGPNTVIGPGNGGAPAADPQPSGLALLALGAGGVLALRRRRKAP